MGGASSDRGVVVAGTLVAELGRVTLVHHANPSAIARRLVRRNRVRLIRDAAGAARLAEELEIAGAVKDLGVTDGRADTLAAALADEEADRALLAERDRLRASPTPPPDLDRTIERLAQLAGAVQRARNAEARARARLDAAARAAGAGEPSPLTRVEPEAARAVAQRVAAATEHARRIQERLNVAHTGPGRDWSVVTAHHRYGLAKARFARRATVALAVLATGLAAPSVATAVPAAGVRGGAVVVAFALLARAIRRLRSSRAQLDNALFWAGLSNPDRLASRNLDSQIAAVDITELRRAEAVLAETLRTWESLAGPGTDPADCETLLAEAQRQIQAGLPEAHDGWMAATEVAASADLAWRATLAELGLPSLDADAHDTAVAALRARADDARRLAELEAAAPGAEARIAARAVLRAAIADARGGDDPMGWFAHLGAEPPPSLVVVLDADDVDPDPGLAPVLRRLCAHAPVALVTGSVRRWSGIIDIDLDLREDEPATHTPPERAWFASS